MMKEATTNPPDLPRSPNSPLTVAIVGGGWAGLAAAVELSAAGALVTLFEAAKQLGGRARSVDIQGHALDNGQHILIGAYRETLRLMRKAGVNPEQRCKRLPLTLCFPREAFQLRLPRLPPPFNLAWGLLRAKCRLGEKIAAARFMRALKACRYTLDEDVAVAELLDRHRQTGVLRRLLWEPLCLAALNTAPENASAQIFVNVLRDSLGGRHAATDLLLPASDLNRTFPDAAAEFLLWHAGEIRLSTRIDALKPLLAAHGGSFDHVVLATAAQHAAPLLAEIPETSAIAALLSSYVYEPIGTVYLVYPPGTTLPFPMLGLIGDHPERLGQWVFDRGQLDGVSGVMGFVLSAFGAWSELDGDTLASALHHELQQALGQPLPPPLWRQTIRERRATFSCRPGLARPTTTTPLAGLWLAGDYVCAGYPATLEGAVRSGVAAANGILGG